MEPIRGDEDAACRYEDAEEAFLVANWRITTGRRSLPWRTTWPLGPRAWSAKAYAAYHASTDEQRASLDSVTERTEVLDRLRLSATGRSTVEIRPATAEATAHAGDDRSMTRLSIAGAR